MPCPQRLRKIAGYVGPPRLLHSDLAMFLLSEEQGVVAQQVHNEEIGRASCRERV